ncbi:DUF3967 domain-containing protein [Bacillus sp. EAC]|uniref:DUF3967 domain-containing protein n=1 Tax=Bacillus sp. EAC TaxID=1978338 RepID=UPI000B42EEBE|nr:DUF3967 domain-containing protein [Bacillus sp. EAC]
MSVIFTSKDISKKLKIGKSLVREISKQLEKESYEFTKNQETRIYSEKDLILMQAIVEDYHRNQNQNLFESIQSELDQLNNRELQVESTDDISGFIPFQHQVDEISTDMIQLTSNPTLEKTAQDTIELHIDNVESNTEETSVEMKELDLVHNAKVEDINEDIQSQVEEIFVEHTVLGYETISDNFVEAKETQILSVIDESTIKDVIVDEVYSQNLNLVSSPTHSNPDQLMFEDFMLQISNLANQNEQILLQNQTLIKQNLEKDQKLEKILNSVEEKSEELQELASVIEEKDEKLEQMFEEIQIREVGRDAQLMRMIREMQETKKMVAASKEKDWKNSLKSFFVKPKTVK